MAKVIVNDEYLSGIADAIRNKLSVSTKYKPAEMAPAIESIQQVGHAPLVDTVIDVPEQTTASQTLTYSIPDATSKGYEMYVASFEYLGDNAPASKKKTIRIVQAMTIHGNPYFVGQTAGSEVFVNTNGALGYTSYGTYLAVGRYCNGSLQVIVPAIHANNVIPQGQWRFKLWKVFDVPEI